ncbi:prolipoprotein diacylglyceryl transferase [Thermodesulforhabdus norvegica]|uniref:Phosphatidylglycerol--prolipoprotein diacylglyceryl transferase n=1 Tax=Thermodesulforhabdus norvegica TaxID=39841 RepID=A0A1I4SKI8_9BACT|nr:prolipoprotein diacylglyceryl transferase [Thermodesulforhabdus norvegica]SFM64901.1 phosphatidylglycerol:prolipoprotein diacylglycerol transferase [Thermodesulforhabdus norvegica]
MIPYPHIDPDIVRIGPFHIRWYGLMYLLGFIAAYFVIPRQEKSRSLGLQGATLQDLLFWVALGLIVGARAGHLVFYQYPYFDYYLSHPLEIIALWHGGMSFHGGLIGSVLAGYIFCRKKGLPFWGVADCVVVAAPIGLGLGRIGNFINGELYGRITEVPWAMVFPMGGPFPRHPSQLYEAFGEGLILFAILWKMQKKNLADGMMVALFLICYGTIRFILEFFREPDPQIGFILGFFSMGQVLCAGMILAGSSVIILLKKRKTNGS